MEELSYARCFYKALTKSDLFKIKNGDVRKVNKIWEACLGNKNGLIFIDRLDETRHYSLDFLLKKLKEFEYDGDFIVKNFKVSENSFLKIDRNFYDPKDGELILEGMRVEDVDDYTIRIIYNNY